MTAKQSPPSPPRFAELHEAADKASLVAQQRHLNLLRAELSVLLAAVAMPLGANAFPQSDPARKYFAVGSAACVVVALACSQINRHYQLQARWYAARALAESIKSESWRYVMRAGGYANDDANERFFSTVKELTSLDVVKPAMSRLPGETSPEWLTADMKELRTHGRMHRQACYFAHRLRDQQRWYQTKATANQTSESNWFGLATGAQLGAFASALWTIFGNGPLDVVSLAATAATSAIAWTNTKDLAFHAQSYANIANELSRLVNASSLVKSDDDLTMLVDNVEHTISREHTIWVARKR